MTAVQKRIAKLRTGLAFASKANRAAIQRMIDELLADQSPTVAAALSPEQIIPGSGIPQPIIQRPIARQAKAPPAPNPRRAIDIAELRRLAGEGVGVVEIGKRLGFGSGAVRRAADGNGIAIRDNRHGNAIGKGAAARKQERPAAEPPPPRVPRSPVKFPPSGRCVWPDGHTGEAGFRFCGERVAEPGKPYCAGHHARAFARHPHGAEG